MLNLIKSLFQFLLPIIKTAALQVVADEISRLAYPEGARRSRRFTEDPEKDAEATAGMYRPDLTAVPNRYHETLLVAVDISAPNMEFAHAWLEQELYALANSTQFGIEIHATWIADDSATGSDNESAVFVQKGEQNAARGALSNMGLS